MRPSRFLLRHVPKEGVTFLALLCFVCCGCSTSYIVTPTQRGGDYSFNELASEFNEKQADIILNSGSVILGSWIRMNADSLFWSDPTSSKPSAAAVNEVQGIARTNHLVSRWVDPRA
jgi:hypothetical protein